LLFVNNLSANKVVTLFCRTARITATVSWPSAARCSALVSQPSQ